MSSRTFSPEIPRARINEFAKARHEWKVMFLSFLNSVVVPIRSSAA
jgi:hypothetical protein